MSTAAPHLVRVEKGQASPEELAAVTALLLARAGASQTPGHTAAPPHHRKAGWRRLERQRGFPAPHSWQH